MRGIDVETHQCLADLVASVGFDMVGVVERKLDRDKRMMPARFGAKGGSGIEARMHHEYVIAGMKPSELAASDRPCASHKNTLALLMRARNLRPLRELPRDILAVPTAHPATDPS